LAASFLSKSFEMELLAANALSFAMVFSIGIYTYIRFYVRPPGISFHYLLFIIIALTFSLLVNSYFVNFFVVVGRFLPLVSMFFATIVSACFFIAFNLFFIPENALLPNSSEL
jgi:hypothetical protein